MSIGYSSFPPFCLAFILIFLTSLLLDVVIFVIIRAISFDIHLGIMYKKKHYYLQQIHNISDINQEKIWWFPVNCLVTPKTPPSPLIFDKN